VGHKDLAIRPALDGVAEHEVPADKHGARVLSDPELAALDALALRCELYAGPGVDIEWAFAGAEVFLLQCRRVTR
jgi:pyruvate,water dikinase